MPSEMWESAGSDAVDTAFQPRVHRHTVTAADLTASPLTVTLLYPAHNSEVDLSVTGHTDLDAPEAYTVNGAGTVVTITAALQAQMSVGEKIKINYSEAV